ncbi:MAG: hypothetical protein J6K24_02885 [Tidjanibacter sp.]|nr:hypothetical protein [Tidjanibacter sp.]
MKEKSHKITQETSTNDEQGKMKQTTVDIRIEGESIRIKNEDVLMSFDDALRKIMEYKK